MLLNEMFGSSQIEDKLKSGYIDPKQDQSPMKLSDLRKTKLTLLQINRLRMMNDVRKFEQESRIKDIQKQYKAPAAAPTA